MPTSASNKPSCNLICVGSELLRGKINTHASTLARRLASIGIELRKEYTVGDDLQDLTNTIRAARRESPVVIATGGLGPTFDDLTREAASEASSRPLVLSKTLLAGIRRKFQRAGCRMPPANARQAYLLEGAQPIPNHVGTAPGQWLELPAMSHEQRATSRYSSLSAHRSLLILLPGPPAELLPMLDGFVIPWLRKEFPRGVQAEAHLHFVGVPESVVDHKVRPIIRQAGAPHPTPSPGGRGEGKKVDVRSTILAHLGLVDLDVFASARTLARAKATVGRMARQARARLSRYFYGMDEDYPLEKVVGNLLRRNRATIAVAESCTGGLLGARLTEIPGSSDYFLGGVLAYHNAVKTNQLGVPEDLLRRQGAVSAPIARAMAEGVCRKFSSTWGISITGIAGPAGGTPGKPVGLVFIALASRQTSFVKKHLFRGNRLAIRERSVIAALDLLRNVGGYTRR